MASKNRNKVTNLQQLQQRSEELKDAGYTDCPAPGAADLSYPTSALRRSRTVGGGKLVNALTAASSNPFVFLEL